MIENEKTKLPVAPGTNGYASIHHCPYCGNVVVKTQVSCLSCGKKLWDESAFTPRGEKDKER